ncbi:MAG: hypothetical protein ACYCO5_07350 [Acidobacteriaceae bacterium]
MEQEQNSQQWIGAILTAIGQHPALDAVMFEGTTTTIQVTDNNGNTTTQCGTPAEPALWLGPTSVPATYVQSMIGYAVGLGIPATKLSAEAVVGDYFTNSEPSAGPGSTDGHLWPPIQVENTIFNNLNIPANQRTFALSFYEHSKCSDITNSPCTDEDPSDWANQTFQDVLSATGPNSRIILPEMGIMTPVDASVWNTPNAVESLIFYLNKYGVDGGSFWRWTSFEDSEDSDPTLATPVKIRGPAYVYNPVQKEIIDMGGFHLPLVQNGSFEGATVNGVPSEWTAAGSGSVAQYLLSQPEVPTRGTHVMRIITGANANSMVTSTSAMIPVQPGTKYTTTSNDRFSWNNDPDPGAPPASRPQVFINIIYFQANGNASAVRKQDSFAYFQEDSTTGFGTFPLQYTTPSDAAFVEIQFGAARNSLPTPITFDVDNVR